MISGIIKWQAARRAINRDGELAGQTTLDRLQLKGSMPARSFAQHVPWCEVVRVNVEFGGSSSPRYVSAGMTP